MAAIQPQKKHTRQRRTHKHTHTRPRSLFCLFFLKSLIAVIHFIKTINLSRVVIKDMHIKMGEKKKPCSALTSPPRVDTQALKLCNSAPSDGSKEKSIKCGTRSGCEYFFSMDSKREENNEENSINDAGLVKKKTNCLIGRRLLSSFAVSILTGK